MPRWTVAKALETLKRYDLRVPFLTTSTVTNGHFHAVICDYRDLPGYTVKFAIAIYRRSNDRMIARFNVV